MRNIFTLLIGVWTAKDLGECDLKISIKNENPLTQQSTFKSLSYKNESISMYSYIYIEEVYDSIDYSSKPPK